MAENYRQLGASASKQGLHDALNRSGFQVESGLFSSVWPDLAGSGDYCSFLHCDGAGTKSIVAYLMYRETGDPSHFAGLAQDALVMNLDDVFCTGAPDSLMLSNMIARNSSLISDEILGVLLASYVSLQQEFNSLGIPFTLSGGETADCGDVVRTLLVDAVLAGRVRRDKLVFASNVRPGMDVIGLSSTGQASYERRPNSGIGSNGLTLARHALLKSEYAKKFPEVVDPALKEEIRYRGPFSASERPSGLGMSVGEALLSPTRSYSPILAALYNSHPGKIAAVIHLTGGGQTKVLRFTKDVRIVKDNLFDVPPIFRLIQEHGGVDWREMYQVFNMGHRMELYVEASATNEILKSVSSYGVEAKKIGTVEASPSAGVNEVILRSPEGAFDYRLGD